MIDAVVVDLDSVLCCGGLAADCDSCNLRISADVSHLKNLSFVVHSQS